MEWMIGKVVELSVEVSYQLFPDYGSLSLSDCNSHKLTFETGRIDCIGKTES